MINSLKKGDTAPGFTLLDQHGKERQATEFKGKKTIIFFYPAAMTPGCTKEACDFRESESALLAAGYQLIGISKDLPQKLAKFSERDSLEYPLLSDPELIVHSEFNAYGEKKLYGKIVQGVIRSTFILDENWVVVEALHNVKATGHVARIRKLVGLD
ncbi:thioredoxin-dependent thiol peroxidase [Canibacter sp. lx-72]|uniref:thioredoxin-dependent thiol peroxidase n=1 Tax=Canibacter zhuwentaonis TaxID=2837491 RepID=UPI001BDC5C48|nr:thioredoxin-dependent thiol peroxidase [Canibacter zhuwentaonis]MBT1017539.1 thioredoxin-dependent thiol peroxidase [Canibacter zhuwentaonis]